MGAFSVAMAMLAFAKLPGLVMSQTSSSSVVNIDAPVSAFDEKSASSSLRLLTENPLSNWARIEIKDGYCVDLENFRDGYANGEGVVLRKCSGYWSNYWKYDYKGRLVNRKSGKCLENGGDVRGDAYIYSCHNGEHQRWTRGENGRYMNKKDPNMILGVKDSCGGLQDGLGIELQSKIFGNSLCACAQQWMYNSEECEPQWSALNIQDGFCAEPISSYNSVVVKKCSGGEEQLWRHYYDGSIRHKKTGQCLEVGAAVNKDKKAFIWSCNNMVHQKWVRDPKEGRYANRANRSLVLGVDSSCDGPSEDLSLEVQHVQINTPALKGCWCAQKWSFNEEYCWGTSTKKLIDVLEEIEEQTRSCETDGLEVATYINKEIIPNLKSVTPLFTALDQLLHPFKIIYNYRHIIKMIVKFIPKIGKPIGFLVDKVLALYKGLQGFKENLGEIAPKADRLIQTLENVSTLLAKQIEVVEGVNESKIGVGVAHMAGRAADAASLSKDVVTFASESACGAKEVEDFASVTNLEVLETVRDAAMVCTAIPRKLADLKLGFLKAVNDIVQEMYGVIEPFVVLINTMIDTVLSTATEVACCTVSPHKQFAVEAIIEAAKIGAAVVEASTCFAGPLEGLLDDLLRELVPDVAIDIDLLDILPLFNFTFEGIEYDKDTCEISFESPIVDITPDFDLDFKFHFDLYSFLGIEDDGMSFEDDIKKSCNPATIMNDIGLAPGGDCCCAARNLELSEGTYCLDWDAFFLDGSYEIASRLTGYERCTCCKDGVFNTQSCGGQIGYCGNTPPTPKQLGESCPSTADCECARSMECGKKDYFNEDKYVCCEDTFVPGGWTSDLCVQQNEGARCPTTEDRECVGSMGCALEQAGSNTYICCKQSSIFSGLDYCNELGDGKKCWSDSMCKSNYCKGNASGLQKGTCTRKKNEGEQCPSEQNADCHNGSCYRSTRYGDYLCCKDTNHCGPWDGGCNTGYHYCSNYGSRLG